MTTDTTDPSETHARERLTQSLKHMVDEADHLLAKAERSGSEQFMAARRLPTKIEVKHGVTRRTAGGDAWIGEIARREPILFVGILRGDLAP